MLSDGATRWNSPCPETADGRRSGLNELRTLLGIGSDILKGVYRESSSLGLRRRAKRRAAARPPTTRPPILPATPTMTDFVFDGSGLFVTVSIMLTLE